MSEKTSDYISTCAELLIAKGLTLAFAESATCGRIAADFSLASDAGKFLMGGLGCYNACIKENLLDVDPQLIKQFTPESPEVTLAITQGLGKLFQADLLIGCTGLTCPGGSETRDKPVGTMFIHGIHNGQTIFQDRSNFAGDQHDIIEGTINRTAFLLQEYLKKSQVSNSFKVRKSLSELDNILPGAENSLPCR